MYIGAGLHDGSFLTAGDLAGLRQSAGSPPDTSPMAAMLRDAAVASGAVQGHFGAASGPPGQPPPHAGLAGGHPGSALHGPPPFSRYSGLRHPGPPPPQQTQQLPPNSQSAPQPPVEVPAADIW